MDSFWLFMYVGGAQCADERVISDSETEAPSAAAAQQADARACLSGSTPERRAAAGGTECKQRPPGRLALGTIGRDYYAVARTCCGGSLEPQLRERAVGLAGARLPTAKQNTRLHGPRQQRCDIGTMTERRRCSASRPQRRVSARSGPAGAGACSATFAAATLLPASGPPLLACAPPPSRRSPPHARR